VLDLADWSEVGNGQMRAETDCFRAPRRYPLGAAQ
jgi:hypothetical protein